MLSRGWFSNGWDVVLWLRDSIFQRHSRDDVLAATPISPTKGYFDAEVTHHTCGRITSKITSIVPVHQG